MRMAGVPDGRGRPWVRFLFWLLRRRTGAVPEPLRLYAHRPEILRAFSGLVRAVGKSGALPERVKRLVMYRTARLVDCPF